MRRAFRTPVGDCTGSKGAIKSLAGAGEESEGLQVPLAFARTGLALC